MITIERDMTQTQIFGVVVGRLKESSDTVLYDLDDPYNWSRTRRWLSTVPLVVRPMVLDYSDYAYVLSVMTH